MGGLKLELTVDMEKAIGWKGLTFFANGYQIHGQSITGSEPRRADAGELHRGAAVDALVRAMAGAEAARRSPVVPLRPAVRQTPSSSSARVRGAFLNGVVGLAVYRSASTCPTAARPIRSLRRPRGSPLIQTTTSGFLIGVFSGDPAGDCARRAAAGVQSARALFPFHSPAAALSRRTINYNQGDGELAGTLKLGAWRLSAASSSRASATMACRSGSSAFPACSPRTTTASTSCSTR